MEAFNPQLRLLRSTRRGRRWRTESLFPNYLFARFVLEALLEKVSYTPGVKFVLRFGDRAPEVAGEVIENLRQELTELGTQVISDTPVEGEQIEIAHGAFEGTKALVARVLPGEHRVRVLIDVMGRSVPAELSLDLVLFNRRKAAEIALKQADEMAVQQAETVSVALGHTHIPIPREATAGRLQLSP